MSKSWKAKWIMDRAFAGLDPIELYRKETASPVPHKHRAELKNHHMLVRKTFTVTGDASDAYLDITGDDYYKVYINGCFVGQGPAQSPFFQYNYNRYSVSSFLQEGVNVIAVHIYYHGLISHAYNSGDYRQGLFAELSIQGQVAAATDATWKYAITKEYGDGHVVGYDTQFMENIDQRVHMAGWLEAGFDDRGWQPAFEHSEDDHRVVLQPTPPVSVYEAEPFAIVSIENGYLLDFGRELTGQLSLSAKGGAGQKLEVRYGEELTDSGRVRYEMRCNCLYQEWWTLSGGEDAFEGFDYKAFRYAEVLTEQGVEVDPGSVKAIIRHYPWQNQACVFESSSPLLNAIWSICRDGVKYGSQEHYVDCPSREKGQYLGDNTVITHAHAYLAGDLRLFRKSLQDFALLARRVCPGMMAVASGSYMQEIADFSFQWPLQLLQYYKQSGDLEFVREMYPVAEAMLKHFETYRRDDALLANVWDKWNLIDWPETMRDGYDYGPDRPERCHNVINAFYYGAMKATAEIGELLTGSASGRLQADLAVVRQAFLNRFYNKETKLFVDSEQSDHDSLHANALPLLFGLAPDEARRPIAALIRAKRLSCGVYMAYFVLNALAEAGEYSLLYELITSDDLHSWSTMVKEGATTCFETWSKELKPNASLCHPWASSPIPVLIEHLIGLKPAIPGWKQVSFNPRLPPELREVKLAFDTVAGRFVFSAINGHYELIVPEGVAVI
ncbi:family 78 glycoside hydrolase catalytic domain [Paenibacillus contaminans]|uniref:alpha-L-rhamnosidase n=1 Tax=Paenibacillus contaminans TaxID=450362 RepID=A0A329MMM4_9BACL|nr:family 78 glycoside hydrolase catalytic domain [Paenibacillus contaminans]RAV19157.1 alpha-L-rhamnosidase [Paenibacillus contaminans]